MYDLPNRVYETKLTAIKDLRVAGSKTYQNTFMELYNDKATREQAGWATSVGYERMQKILGTKVADLTFGKKRDAAIARAREDFDVGLQERNNEINKKFLSKLKEKGYDAIEDQFSKAVDGTDGPLIVLDPRNSVKGKTVGEVIYKDGKAKTVSIAQGNKEFDRLKADIDKDRKKIANEYKKLEKQHPDKKPYEIAKLIADKVHGDQVAVESVILVDVIRKRKGA